MRCEIGVVVLSLLIIYENVCIDVYGCRTIFHRIYFLLDDILNQLSLTIAKFIPFIGSISRDNLCVDRHSVIPIVGAPGFYIKIGWCLDHGTLIHMLMALYPDYIICSEKSTNLIHSVIEHITPLSPFHNHFACLSVFCSYQAVVAGNKDVIHLIPVFVNDLFDPSKSDRQMVIFQRDNKHILTDDIVIKKLSTLHVKCIRRDILLHAFDPLHTFCITTFVVPYQRNKFHSGISKRFSYGSPLVELQRRALVCEIPNRGYQIHIALLKLF